MAQLKDLHEFLTGAELQHYYDNFAKDLKVTTVQQIKYVSDDDLVGFGMSKPEIRRLRRFFSKERPKGALGRLKKILAKGPQDSGLPLSTQGQQLHLSSKSSGKYIIPEDAVSVHKTIGRGEFGAVQQGVWMGESGEQVMVAVKCLSKEKIKAQMSDFLQEAIVMHSLDHPCVVHLFGVVLVSDSIMLVTELAPLRSLLECLREGSLRSSFSVSLLCDLAIQIADGMSYLESRSLVHRDLTAGNVLMFAKDEIKISDFGLSRAVGMTRDYYRSADGSTTKLPVAWCAPESINFLKFTSASDVWSFAVTLWEMFSFGTRPWEGLSAEEIIQNMEEPACRRLNKPDHCPDEWYSLMLRCWQIEATDRPKFCDIFNLLQQGKPSRVIAITNGSNGDCDSSYLVFRTNDIVTVLAKMAEDSPRPGLWKGLSDSGSRPGFFDPIHFSPYVESADVPILRKTKKKTDHSGSARVSLRNAGKLTSSMISNPQSDLRHIGHVGYDGAVFGDVSFIGDNYDKLPIKVGNTGKSYEDGHSQLPASLVATGSAESSVVISAEDRLTSCASNDFDSFGDFELPDFSGSFDLGGSLMDEVMKALGNTSDDNSLLHFDDLKPISMDLTNHISKDVHKTNTSTSTNQLKTNQPENEDADQDDEEDDDDDDDDDEDEEEDDEAEEGVARQSNNSLFGSSSCSSKDPLDDYNGLRKPDESSSDRRYHSSSYDQSSSEKSFKEYGSMNRSDEKIANNSPLFVVHCSGSLERRNHKALNVVEPQDLSTSHAVASGSIKALGIISSDRSDIAENQNDHCGLSFPRESDNMISPASSGVLSKNVAPESRKLYNSSAPIIVSEDASVLANTSDRNALQGSVTRVVRPLTQNIRAPQGIPGREIHSGKPFISPAAVVVPPDEEFDSNPLRRLRDSQAGFGRPMMTFRPVGSAGRGVAVAHISSSDDSNKNNLNVNLSFFDKLKEQELQKLP